MASPDHRDLIEEIGSQNSPVTEKSISSASNLSSLNFNLSLKHLVPIKDENGKGMEGDWSKSSLAVHSNLTGNYENFSVRAAINNRNAVDCN